MYKFPYYVCVKDYMLEGNSNVNLFRSMNTSYPFSKIEIVSPGFAILHLDADANYAPISQWITLPSLNVPFDIQGEWRIYKKIDARRWVLRVMPEFPVGEYDVSGETVPGIPFPYFESGSNPVTSSNMNFCPQWMESVNLNLWYVTCYVYVPDLLWVAGNRVVYWNINNPEYRKNRYQTYNYKHDGKFIKMNTSVEISNLWLEIDGDTWLSATNTEKFLVPWLPEKVQE